jgi:hypothetical protein
MEWMNGSTKRYKYKAIMRPSPTATMRSGGARRGRPLRGNYPPTTAHPLHTRIDIIFGAALSRARMRPKPRWPGSLGALALGAWVGVASIAERARRASERHTIIDIVHLQSPRAVGWPGLITQGVPGVLWGPLGPPPGPP